MIKAAALLSLCFFFLAANAQPSVNWTQDQLLEPSELAKDLAANKSLPLIFSVGPGAIIPQSITIGPAHDTQNFAYFKKNLSTLARDTPIVVYCGCCPFAHCPNVQPAIEALKEAGFTKYKLLNLPHNLKSDWIDKGYPVVK